MTLGGNIRIFREASAMTQEQMASYLHISPQAISKWERDESMPDSALLPAIADILDVSIDRLFERKKVTTDDMVYAILYRMTSLTPEERWKELRTIAYAGEKGLTVEHHSTEEILGWRFWDRGDRETVRWETEHGFVLSSNRPELPFSTSFPEPENGWGAVLKPEEFREFFEILSEEEVLRTLFALYEKKTGCFSFDDGYAKKEFGLADPEATLGKLRKFRLFRMMTHNIDGVERRIWQFDARCELLAMFVMLKEFLSHHQHFDLQAHGRQSPYLREKE